MVGVADFSPLSPSWRQEEVEKEGKIKEGEEERKDGDGMKSVQKK